MSESIGSADFFSITPSRQERALVYIGDQMNMGEREVAQEMAQTFENLERPMASTAVLIPVAAHQDADYIFHTMGEYAKQRNCDPFTIFLYLNAPLAASEDAESLRKYDQSISEAERALEAFPQLDIRATAAMYDTSTIGEIRRDLWNAALLLAFHEKTFAASATDVIGINNDIDTHAISPHYIARIQQYYKRHQMRADSVGVPQAPLKPVGTRVTHAVLPAHPNVGKVTSWIDNSNFQAPGHVSYEAGVVIPFSHYTLHGGFDRSGETHETRWVYDETFKHLTGAHLYTSPRRYIDRVREHGSRGIWTPGSFGANDQCRDTLKSDISVTEAEDLILERLHDDVQSHWLRGALHPILTAIKESPLSDLKNPTFESAMTERAVCAATKQHAKAERLLRTVIKSEALADILETGFDARSYAAKNIRRCIELNRQVYGFDISDEATELGLKLK